MSISDQIDRINTEVSTQETLLDQALAAIANKAAGGGSTEEKLYLEKIYSTTVSGNGSLTYTIEHNTGIVPLAVKLSVTTTGGTNLVRYMLIIKYAEERVFSIRTGYETSSSAVKAGTLEYSPSVWDGNSIVIRSIDPLYFASGKTYEVVLYA